MMTDERDIYAERLYSESAGREAALHASYYVTRRHIQAIAELTEHITMPPCGACGNLPKLLFHADQPHPWKISCTCGRYAATDTLVDARNRFVNGPWKCWLRPADEQATVSDSV